jgi:hypothetical protein
VLYFERAILAFPSVVRKLACNVARPFSGYPNFEVTILIARVLFRLNRGIAESQHCRFSASFLNSALPVSNRREATVAGKLFVRMTTFFHRPPPSRKIDDPFHIFPYIYIYIYVHVYAYVPPRARDKAKWKDSSDALTSAYVCILLRTCAVVTLVSSSWPLNNKYRLTRDVWKRSPLASVLPSRRLDSRRQSDENPQPTENSYSANSPKHAPASSIADRGSACIFSLLHS